MVPEIERRYGLRMRVNFLFLAALMLLLAAQKFLGREYVFAAAFAALAVAMTVVHFIRVRRFKSYDEAQKMRNFD
jgi:hypothetical protein